ncbi:MAG: pyruvate synthase [Candidatus Tectomicrobia bacterium]|nr:pyruvate synthase [Candidatus Tectomicrobia bacterium]
MREVRIYKNLKEIPREEFICPGTSTCPGCGGLEALRLGHKVLGEKVIFVNAAGCFTLLALFPLTPFKGAWLYTNMASAPAGAQGVRDALDILIEKGRLSKEEDLTVVVLAGDGSTYDMGLSSTSAAIHRGLDFYYFCYDNEAYGNTGFQMSSSSPYASRTGTTPPGGLTPEGTIQRKKDIFEIWRAHKPPYIATVSPRHPVDLAEKFARSKQFRGPKLFLALSPCPPGWGIDPAKTHEAAKLAVETGLWPLKEAIYGEVHHTYIPKKFPRIEEYLAMQGRFRHLFSPVKQEEVIQKIKEEVDRYWEPWRK